MFVIPAIVYSRTLVKDEKGKSVDKATNNRFQISLSGVTPQSALHMIALEALNTCHLEISRCASQL